MYYLRYPYDNIRLIYECVFCLEVTLFLIHCPLVAHLKCFLIEEKLLHAIQVNEQYYPANSDIISNSLRFKIFDFM